MKTSTKIDGYSVEFEKYEEDGETRTQCFVMKKDYNASLECLDAIGELQRYSDGRMIKVDQQTIDAIRVWAEGQGY
jgi:hypothetical protein